MITSGFFNSVNHDRLYDAEQFSSVFDGIISDGVYENYGSAFMVTAATQNSSVVVGTGRAWFDHTWTLNDAPYLIQMDPPNEMVTRIDAIVIDVDRRKDTRKNTIVYVKGDPVSSAPPMLINEELHKQYPICHINRKPGPDGLVSQSEIEYLVGTDDCPAVTGILEAQNLENLWAQLDSEFNEWWEDLQDIVGGDNPSIDFLNRLEQLENRVDNIGGGLLDGPVSEAFKTGDYGLKASSFKAATSFDTGTATKPVDIYWSPYTSLGKKNIKCPITLAPNGEVIGIGGYGLSTQSSKGMRLMRCNTDGVKSYYDIAGAKPIASYVTDGYKYPPIPQMVYKGGVPILIKLDATTFPVRFVFALPTARGNQQTSSGSEGVSGDVKYSCMTYTISVASDGVVSGSASKIVDYPESFTVASGEGSACATQVSFPTNNGNHILWAGNGGTKAEGSIGTTYRFKRATIFRVNPDGVISGGTTLAESKLNAYYAYFKVRDTSYGDDGKAYQITEAAPKSESNSSSNQSTEWCEINEETLDVTLHVSSFLDDVGPYPTQTETECVVESFKGSETNGLQKMYRSAGVDHSAATTTEKIRPYFLGASNASGGLPEGDFIAANQDGVYYAIGPNGETIAIGENGGAAVLKKKTSLPTSFSLNNVYYKNVGYVNSNGVLSYLILPEANPESKNNYTTSSCIVMKRS